METMAIGYMVEVSKLVIGLLVIGLAGWVGLTWWAR